MHKQRYGGLQAFNIMQMPHNVGGDYPSTLLKVKNKNELERAVKFYARFFEMSNV